MIYLVISIVVLGLLTALFTFFTQKGDDDGPSPVTAAGDCSSCTGTDSRCEQECMMEAATQSIVYYDDEELDIYRGRPSDQYSDDETEAFAEVLETLKPDEVKAWGRSLILRGINMPDGIKDEFVALAE